MKSKKVYELFTVIVNTPGLSVSDLAKKVKNTSITAVSEQLIPLKDIGLVIEKKEGKFRFFYPDKEQVKKKLGFDLDKNKNELKKHKKLIDLSMPGFLDYFETGNVKVSKKADKEFMEAIIAAGVAALIKQKEKK
ncbi:MAG: helix-turn-helix domain-containing protein [archaeon]|nr:helix-turn-helix domain-containing protein [archaeon]